MKYKLRLKFTHPITSLLTVCPRLRQFVTEFRIRPHNTEIKMMHTFDS